MAYDDEYDGEPDDFYVLEGRDDEEVNDDDEKPKDDDEKLKDEDEIPKVEEEAMEKLFVISLGDRLQEKEEPKLENQRKTLKMKWSLTGLKFQRVKLKKLMMTFKIWPKSLG